MSARKSSNKKKGKLLYHSKDESRKRVGEGQMDVVEKMVTHAEDGLFCKYYMKKNGKATKVMVKAPTDGKEYTLTVKKGDSEPKVSTHNKKDLVAFLKKDPELGFMLEYIDKAKSLARSKSKSKSKKTKSKSKKTKKTKSKSNKTESKSKKTKKTKSKSNKTESKSKKTKKTKSKSKGKKKNQRK